VLGTQTALKSGHRPSGSSHFRSSSLVKQTRAGQHRVQPSLALSSVNVEEEMNIAGRF